MEERKEISTVSKKNSLRVFPRIIYYLRNKRLSLLFKNKKHPLLASGWGERIFLFSNSLEHISSIYGHKLTISCLTTISDTLLVSGSFDNTIKLWDWKKKTIMHTLSEHMNMVSALCHINQEVLVSGSEDTSLIVWELGSKQPKYVLIGHISTIRAIIQLTNSSIISGEWRGDVRMWNIDEGLCIKHFPRIYYCDYLIQMKKLNDKQLAICTWYRVTVLTGTWEFPNKREFSEFGDSGRTIEYLSDDILLRGSDEGTLEIIDCTGTGNLLHPFLKLHSRAIYEIMRLSKDIVITTSRDGSIKVINPISRKCYSVLKNKSQEVVMALICDEY